VFVLFKLVMGNDEHQDCAIRNEELLCASAFLYGIYHLQLRYCNISHVLILLVISHLVFVQAVFINNKLKCK